MEVPNSDIVGFISAHEQLDETVALSPYDFLWEEASRAAEIGDSVQEQLDGIHAEFMRCRSSSSFADRNRADELESEYWTQFGKLQELRGVEGGILAILGQYEEGEISDEELRALLPEQGEDNTTEEVGKPKAEKAIDPMDRMDLFLLGYTGVGYTDRIFGFGHDGGSYGSETDPRRLSTGRNRTSWSARGRGVTGDMAGDAFFTATADTHGGKSRRPGKNGKVYVGKNGRRIRKR